MSPTTSAVLADPVLLVAGLCLLGSVVCGVIYLRHLRRLFDPFQPARGRHLDTLATVYGYKRSRWWWIFRETDRAFRKRVTEGMRNYSANLKTEADRDFARRWTAERGR